jgi:hypothetical protein
MAMKKVTYLPLASVKKYIYTDAFQKKSVVKEAEIVKVLSTRV